MSKTTNKKTINTFVLNTLSEDDIFRSLIETLFTSEETTIRIVINSTGGGIFEMFSIYDAIRYAVEVRKVNVQTIGIGAIMSSALLIFAAGSERYIGKNASIMWHWGTDSIKDADIHTFKNEVRELERSEKIGNNLLAAASKGKLTLKEIQKALEYRLDWYITPAEAIKLGLADKYLDELPAP